MIFLAHLALALTLFLVMNWLGRHAQSYGYDQITVYERADESPLFNTIYRLLAPQVFLVLLATASVAVGAPGILSGAWRVTGLYFLVRWLFNLAMGRAGLIDWPSQLLLGLVATGMSYWLSANVLTSPDAVLPDPKNLLTELWLVVILFLYQTLNTIRFSGSGRVRRQRAYLSARYASLKGRFHGIVGTRALDPWIEPLVYAILILEDFNRPALAQWVERWIFFPLRIARTLGPMQVATNRRISDSESVERGTQIVTRHYAACSVEYAEEVRHHRGMATAEAVLTSLTTYERYDIARRVAVRYNPDGIYADEIRVLYESLIARFYPELICPATA